MANTRRLSVAEVYPAIKNLFEDLETVCKETCIHQNLALFFS